MSDEVALDEGSGFGVRLVGTAEEHGVFTVGIAADAGGTGRCLLFSSAANSEWDDDQDIADEEATYCVVDEVQSTAYGGVISCVLTSRDLRLKFTPEAAHRLHLKPDCRFPLLVDEASIEQLRDGLRRVLTGGRSGRAAPSELVL